MMRILITGVSGTGKSTLVEALLARGLRAVDADSDAYSHLVDVPPQEMTGVGGGKDWVWQEARIQELLSDESEGVLFVSGCSPNQAQFYDRFDHIVLLTAPDGLIRERLTTRTNNPFGKHPGELERSLELKRLVEPALRRSATHEIDTSRALEDVVEAVLRLAAAEG